MKDNTKERRAPAFQFYADDFLAGTSDMSAEEVGGYIRLLCHQWTKGGIPNDEDRAGRMAGLMGSPSIRYVMAKFSPCEDGMLRNARLERVREEQAAYKAKQSTSGRNGALSRWRKCQTDGDTNGDPIGTAIATPMATPIAKRWPEDGSPSPSPIIKEDICLEARIEKELRLQEAKTVLQTLNEVSGRNFRETETTISMISERLQEPGVDLEGVLKMVRRQAAAWMPDPKMAEYVRPETLFGKKKFDGYYANRELPIPSTEPAKPIPPKRPPGQEWRDDPNDWRHAL